MLPGDHGHVVYGTAADRHRILRAFLSAGVEAGQRVAYLSGELPDASEDWLCGDDPGMRRAVGSGQILLVAAGGAVHRGTCGDLRVDPRRTLKCLQLMAEEAMIDGYPALRLAADAAYLTEGLDAARVVPFEQDFTRLVEAYRMLALCLYPAPAIPAQVAPGPAAGLPDGQVRPPTWARVCG